MNNNNKDNNVQVSNNINNNIIIRLTNIKSLYIYEHKYIVGRQAFARRYKVSKM